MPVALPPHHHWAGPSHGGPRDVSSLPGCGGVPSTGLREMNSEKLGRRGGVVVYAEVNAAWAAATSRGGRGRVLKMGLRGQRQAGGWVSARRWTRMRMWPSSTTGVQQDLLARLGGASTSAARSSRATAACVVDVDARRPSTRHNRRRGRPGLARPLERGQRGPPSNRAAPPSSQAAGSRH